VVAKKSSNFVLVADNELPLGHVMWL